LYQHGFGVELLDAPQAVVLAADDDVYRRLGAAESRGGAETQGDPGPMLLSPDGLHVALGDHDSRAADLGIVDLGSGDLTSYDLPEARSVIPVAWAPDGSRVAYVSDGTATNPYAGGPVVGDLVVLDLASGETSPVPGGIDVSVAAFSPDGDELAMQRSSGSGGLAVVDLSSGAVR
ncbi:TolB family protein, partial [Nocardioides hankookensis]